jgi:hypothetical protein
MDDAEIEAELFGVTDDQAYDSEAGGESDAEDDKLYISSTHGTTSFDNSNVDLDRPSSIDVSFPEINGTTVHIDKAGLFDPSKQIISYRDEHDDFIDLAQPSTSHRSKRARTAVQYLQYFEDENEPQLFSDTSDDDDRTYSPSHDIFPPKKKVFDFLNRKKDDEAPCIHNAAGHTNVL